MMASSWNPINRPPSQPQRQHQSSYPRYQNQQPPEQRPFPPHNHNMPRRPLPPGLPPPPMDSYRTGPPRHTRFEDRERDRDRDRPSDRRSDRPPPMYHFGSDNDYNQRPPPRGSTDDYHRRPSPPRHNYNQAYDSYVPGTAPPALRPSSNVYQPARGGPQRQHQQDRGPPGREFDFRSEAPPSMTQNNFRPPSPPRRNRRKDGQGQRGGRGQGGYRGRAGPRLASDREFLKGNREPTPEMMPGMDEHDAGVRYKPLEDVSDSEEAEMEISDEDVAEKPAKKARTLRRAADDDTVPKWSNPDPYTALPPPDATHAKKKDVVKLIRKARVEMNSGAPAKVDAADDFISFNFGNDDPFKAAPPSPGPGVDGAPTGPRFSHAANIHRQQAPVAPAPTQLGTYPVGQAQTINGGMQPQTPSTKKSGPVLVNFSTSRTNAQIKNDENIRPSKKVIDIASDPSLGTRKRTFNDVIKPPPVLALSLPKPSRPAKGPILKEWLQRPGPSNTPWLEIDHSDTVNIGLWLHKEIRDFHDFVKPREFESIIRTRLIDDLRIRVQREYGRHGSVDIRPFGSFPAGLYLPTADMDLVCISDEYLNGGRPKFGLANSFYRRFADFIYNENLAVQGTVETIPRAKVPLVKYQDKLTGLKVDISFENTTGIVANTTFQEWKTQFPAMPVLVTLIKHLLCMRGLNEPVNGGIGGFSVTCLVVSLLQLMPQVQSRNMIPEHHLGEVLMEFLDLYGNQFNYLVNGISLNPPGYILKSQLDGPYNANRPKPRLCILDPNRPDNDIAGGSANTETILTCFSKCFMELQARMGKLETQTPANRRKESILGVVIGGNYASFKAQREHLAHVYEKIYGPLPDEEA